MIIIAVILDVDFENLRTDYNPRENFRQHLFFVKQVTF